MKLFCVPHAGGSANVYLAWRRQLAPSIELVPTELAGRGRRIAEPLNHRFADVLADVLTEATRDAPPTDYALFGHSFGALLAYELGHVLTQRGYPPQHLFVSASCSPERVGELVIPLAQDDRTLLTSLSYLGGTPAEILTDDEAVALFAPILRADLHALFDYRHSARPKLPCPVTVLLGTEDVVASGADAESWGALAEGPLSTLVLEGGHFAPFEAPAEVTSLINDSLRPTAWAQRVAG